MLSDQPGKIEKIQFGSQIIQWPMFIFGIWLPHVAGNTCHQVQIRDNDGDVLPIKQVYISPNNTDAAFNLNRISESLKELVIHSLYMVIWSMYIRPSALALLSGDIFTQISVPAM